MATQYKRGKYLDSNGEEIEIGETVEVKEPYEWESTFGVFMGIFERHYMIKDRQGILRGYYMCRKYTKKVNETTR